ncbi:MAG: DNA-binding protein [Roseiflexus castenholzii]|nr:MAG: DNA-binding protein [Roseiflexus castenholzii]
MRSQQSGSVKPRVTSPLRNASCAHAVPRIIAEKYLKARLQEAGQVIPRTHDLVVLLNLLLPVEPAWTHLASDLRALTVFGVAFRYPGSSADRTMARDAVRRCAAVRKAVRQSFGLSV